MVNSKVRFGILGAANIARKNWKGIQCSGNTTVVAVASRDPERGKRFVDECQAEVPMETKSRVFDSYEELLADDSVEAVYLPLPTGLRKEWVLRAAAAGKHVICEKPCACTVKDLEEMLEACRQNGVQFMDGVMFMHSQRLSRMKEVLADGKSVGSLKRITSAFTFGSSPSFFSTNIRTHSLLEPLGCLGDLGWYCIRLTLWAMNWQMPRQVLGRAHAEISREGAAPVPTDFSGELVFDDGISASFYCSFITENQQWAILSGSRGYLQVQDFVLPFDGPELTFTAQNTTFKPVGCDFRMVPRETSFKVDEFSQGHTTAQEANLFRIFCNQVRTGSVNLLWPEIALKTQKVTNACFESAGQNSRWIDL